MDLTSQCSRRNSGLYLLSLKKASIELVPGAGDETILTSPLTV